MKRNYSIMFFIFFLLMTAACTGPYFGHTKKQWDNLTDIEKHSIKQEYQTVLDSRNNQAYAKKIIERTESIINHARTHPEH